MWNPAPRLPTPTRWSESLNLDMTAHWQPIVQGFYGKLACA